MNSRDLVVVRYWMHQDEDKVKEYMKENPEHVVASEFLAAMDMDCYTIFKSKDDYEQYKKLVHDNNVYSGWITLNNIFNK